MAIDIEGIVDYERRLASQMHAPLNLDITEVRRDEEEEKAVDFISEDNVPMFSSPKNQSKEFKEYGDPARIANSIVKNRDLSYSSLSQDSKN